MAIGKDITIKKDQLEDIIIYLSCLDYLLEHKGIKNKALKLAIDYLSEQYRNA